MDLMEEFEFKPLTDGLGFHKKKQEESKADISSELPSLKTSEISLPDLNEKVYTKKSLLDEKLSDLPFDFNPFPVSSEPKPSPASHSQNPLFSPALPRESVSVPRVTVPKYKATLQKEILEDEVKTEALQDKSVVTTEEVRPNKIETEAEVITLSPSPNSIVSIFLDSLVVLGLGVLFTLGLIIATGLDVANIVTHSIRDLGTQVGIGLLLYAVTQLYTLISRSFFAQTLGEWSVDQRLGTPEQHDQVSYIFKLVLRNLILTVTGFVLFPLLSIISRRDLLGSLCGLKLQKRD